MRLIRSSGVGNCLFLHAREWGIDLQETKMLQIPGGMPGGGGRGMVTSKIVARITQDLVLFVTQASSAQWQGVKGLHDPPKV